MDSLFVIGLPKGVESRLVSSAAFNNVFVDYILAARNDAGDLRLIPAEHTAIFPFQAYTEGKEPKQLNVLVLPYAPIPQNLEEELAVFEEVGGVVDRPDRGKDGWPRLGDKADDGFLNSLFKTFEAKYFPKRPLTPSEHFFALAEHNTRFLVTDGALQECDTVPKHRRTFLINCADSCCELLDGEVGVTLEQYFADRGIIHAQNSKEKGTLEIWTAGKKVYADTRETHLKQGDKTTRQNATRVYYHYLKIGVEMYVGILHAGPHPSGDISRVHVLT